MNEKRKPFLTLGKSKFSKIANITVLVLILGFVAGKLGFISPGVTTGFEYTISAAELQVTTPDELTTKLRGYVIDQAALENKLNEIGVSLLEFQNNVSMEVVVDTNQNGLKGLVIEFQSKLPREKLRPIYDYISNEIRYHVKNK